MVGAKFWQADDRDHGWNNADSDLTETELYIFDSDNDICGADQTQASCKGSTVDRRDDRLGAVHN